MGSSRGFDTGQTRWAEGMIKAMKLQLSKIAAVHQMAHEVLVWGLRLEYQTGCPELSRVRVFGNQELRFQAESEAVLGSNAVSFGE